MLLVDGGSRAMSCEAAIDCKRLLSVQQWTEPCRADILGRCTLELKHERAHLMPMPAPFDDYVEKPAWFSSICLVSVALIHGDQADILEALKIKKPLLFGEPYALRPPDRHAVRLWI